MNETGKQGYIRTETVPTQAQIEAAAKAIYDLPINWRANKPLWQDARYQYIDEAKAALTAVAKVDTMSDDWDGTNEHNRKIAEIHAAKIDTIERCAQVAENHPDKTITCNRIAAAIRALKDKP